jgi:STE24 endopeptidase
MWILLLVAELQLAPAPAAASGAQGFIDPAAATRAYLDQLPSGTLAKSNAYFEGGYWLQLWDFLWGAVVLFALLKTGLSAKMRDGAERLTRFRALQTVAYWLQFLLVTALLGLPLAIYRDYVREHQYGLSNLTFGAWLGEGAKGLAVSAVFGSLGAVALYAIARRFTRTWWVWGSVAVVVLLALGTLVAPVAIVPLFNDPKKLQDARVTAPILSMARANGISAGEVWEIDASTQTSRISANVSGLLATQRITLNDNLLHRASLPEIEAVMGHEMGHYVLNHAWKLLLQFGIVVLAGSALLGWAFRRLQGRFAVRGIDDLAGLPLAALLLSVYLFALTPMLNSIVRISEAEADAFGLNAARQPDGFARIALQLSEYRKLAPSPWEEAIFYDHPSGRTRIFNAMRWKAEHPETWSR